MAKLFLLISAFGGMTAVILGAFGAHALKSRLSETLLHSYETAVQYQFWHTLALLATALLMSQWPASKLLNASGTAFCAGIFLFCGSLYVLSLSSIRHFGFINIGLLTPVGGVCFIIGWLLLFLAVWQH